MGGIEKAAAAAAAAMAVTNIKHKLSDSYRRSREVLPSCLMI